MRKATQNFKEKQELEMPSPLKIVISESLVQPEARESDKLLSPHPRESGISKISENLSENPQKIRIRKEDQVS